jgi:hypothetical protein
MTRVRRQADNSRHESRIFAMNTKDAAMNTHHNITKLAATALLSSGLALSAFGLAAGIAQAQPVPLPTDGNWGAPHHWCPGDRPPQTGNQGEVVWNNSICHTYYVVDPGLGNVATNIWDGPHPPDNPPRVAPPWWAP